MKACVFIGHPKAVQSDFDFNLIFVHGLLGKIEDSNHDEKRNLGKSHRTWRAHDSIVGQVDHTECWPIDWLPATLGKFST